MIIYTDGACKGNPGPGGWAARLIHRSTGKTRDLQGGEALTTNNRMELTAAARALQALKRPVKVTLYSDSSYLVQAFNQRWLDRWLQNNWRTSNRKPVENQDLWQELLEASRRHQVRWLHVPGHAGVEHNEACDRMAREEA
ncbi:MAG: ribonuclease HI, partial [Candidatus Eremiobacterota bacterium]